MEGSTKGFSREGMTERGETIKEGEQSDMTCEGEGERANQCVTTGLGAVLLRLRPWANDRVPTATRRLRRRADALCTLSSTRAKSEVLSWVSKRIGSLVVGYGL